MGGVRLHHLDYLPRKDLIYPSVLASLPLQCNSLCSFLCSWPCTYVRPYAVFMTVHTPPYIRPSMPRTHVYQCRLLPPSSKRIVQNTATEKN